MGVGSADSVEKIEIGIFNVFILGGWRWNDVGGGGDICLWVRYLEDLEEGGEHVFRNGVQGEGSVKL